MWLREIKLSKEKKRNLQFLKLTKIVIRNLFREFNYEIPVDLAKRATVIYGLNGSGKTTILRLINTIAHAQLLRLYEFDFELVEVHFDEDGGGECVEVEEGHGLCDAVLDAPPPHVDVDDLHHRPGEVVGEYQRRLLAPDSTNDDLPDVFRIIPQGNRRFANEWGGDTCALHEGW